jgi:uncharacterized protein YbdZ (MbtH family)
MADPSLSKGIRMTSPFDDAEAQFLVVRNGDGQYSIWRSDIACPAGWDVVHGPVTNAAAIVYVDQNWHDMRPRSMISDAAE